MDKTDCVLVTLFLAVVSSYWIVYRYGGYRQRQLDKPAIEEQLTTIFYDGVEAGKREQYLEDAKMCEATNLGTH